MKPVQEAIRKFFKTTTLHGFKYLMSRFYSDQIGWVLCCLASACCAGVLCVVLWQRFLIMPALLQLRDISLDVSFQPVPTVAFCPSTDTVANSFLKELKTHGANTSRLPTTLANALQGKNTEDEQIDLLEDLLKFNNVTLLEMLKLYTPDCSQSLRKCRWRGVSMDCGQLFKKELTSWGVCCVATATRFLSTFIPVMQRYDIIKKLDVSLQCDPPCKGFEFFINYFGEDSMFPKTLNSGYNYFAHLTFVLEKDKDDENLIGATCISARDYSRRQCLLTCTEKICGCSDPFRKLSYRDRDDVPPPCPLKRLSCLRTFRLTANTTCHCLPSCQQLITKLVMERGSFKSTQSSLDPFYATINDKNSVILRLRINLNASKLFVLKPTETWLTLLSSLGGVFNMFLGVGLFSALELLFLLLVKIPFALRRSNKIDATSRKVLFHRV